MSPMPRRWFALLGGLCLALTACAGPVDTARVDPKTVLGNLGRSAVATGEPSLPTRNVLFEHGLFEAVDERTTAAIAELHRAMVVSHGNQDLLFALAELSCRPGDHGSGLLPGGRGLCLRSFLFPEQTGNATPGRFDPRVRIAVEVARVAGPRQPHPAASSRSRGTDRSSRETMAWSSTRRRSQPSSPN